jgi:hypothetical protein
VIHGYYFTSPIRDALERNAQRGAQAIPIQGIYGAQKRLEPPSYDEGFETLYHVRPSGGTFEVKKCERGSTTSLLSIQGKEASMADSHDMSEETINEDESAREKKLKRAYIAIATLRKRGDKLTISAVQKESGIARGTFYSELPEWVEVRNIIEGKLKSSSRLELIEVELTEKQLWERQLGDINKKVNALRDSVKEAQNLADDVYDKLLAEIHKYFIIAKETPKERENKAQKLQDYGDLLDRHQKLLAENKRLRAEKGLEGNVLPFSKKEVIDIYPSDKRASLRAQDLNSHCFDAINALDHYFKKPEFAPTLVYLMCGQFASGKSRWIKNHDPINKGTVLYIDGTNHTADMRALFVKRLKGLCENCRIVCCRVFATLDECVGRNKNETRKRTQMTVPEALLHHVEVTFEEVSYHEGFDAIEIVEEGK